MSFELSDEHEAFRKVVRDFAETRDRPARRASGTATTTSRSRWSSKMGELGLFGLVVPEEYGGSGGDFTTLCVAIEELGRVDQSIGITLEAGVGLGINPILTFGTEEQKQRWLPDLVAGRTLAGFGLTEPEAGSDAGATRTRAVLDDGEWVINGAKAFITNSGTVDHLAGDGHRQHRRRTRSRRSSCRAARPGFIVEPAYDKLGWHISDTHGLDLRRLPGARGEPARRARATASGSSSPCSTTAASRSRRWPSAWPRRASSSRVRYAQRAHTFGAPIGSRQGDRLPARRPRGRGRGGPAADLQGRRAQGRRPAGQRGQAGRRDGQAVLDRGRGDRDPGRHPGLRRQRLHGGVPGRSLLPRRQDPRDRRGHLRGAADA